MSIGFAKFGRLVWLKLISGMTSGLRGTVGGWQWMSTTLIGNMDDKGEGTRT